MATNEESRGVVCVAACIYLRVQAKMTFVGRGTAAEMEEASISKEAIDFGAYQQRECWRLELRQREEGDGNVSHYTVATTRSRSSGPESRNYTRAWTCLELHPQPTSPQSQTSDSPYPNSSSSR